MFNKVKLSGATLVVIIILLYIVFSSIYTIDPEEVGVIQRFGKYSRIIGPGLHFKLPWGIEKLTKVKVKRIYKEEFGFRTERSGVRTQYSNRDFGKESLMLTGDLNSAIVQWIVQYRIIDAKKYLFVVRNKRKTLRDLTEAVLRSVVGDHSIDEVLTIGREEIVIMCQNQLQKILDKFNTGIEIVTIKLQDVNPPKQVQPAFNAVNEAEQYKERLINVAWSKYNKQIPKAKGEKEKLISEAEGYALERVNNAEGDVAKFLEVYKEYKNAKEITRRRIYLEKVSKILKNIEDIYIIDEKQRGVLPFLDITNRNNKK